MRYPQHSIFGEHCSLPLSPQVDAIFSRTDTHTHTLAYVSIYVHINIVSCVHSCFYWFACLSLCSFVRCALKIIFHAYMYDDDNEHWAHMYTNVIAFLLSVDIFPCIDKHKRKMRMVFRVTSFFLYAVQFCHHHYHQRLVWAVAIVKTTHTFR